MDLPTLHNYIRNATWFSNLGLFESREGMVAIRNLDPWSSMEEDEPSDVKRITDDMDWLPSSRDQIDPIHRLALEKLISAAGSKSFVKAQDAETYKLALDSLRKVDGKALLQAGPNDFTEAARGSALFAIRRAFAEIIATKPDFWCRLIPVYAAGNWPCGIMPDQTIVVL